MTLRDKMLAVIADTNASVAEREELVEMIAISLLTRKNLFVLGEPGQAKSYAINLFRRHITGARQFERLLSKQSDEEQLFGRVDLASLLPGSVPQTVLEQDATYQNQRFNLRVLVEGIGSMKDEPATWEKLKSGTEKLELYRAALRQYFGLSIYDISAQDTTDLSDTCAQIALPAILIRLLDAVIRRGELSKNEHSQLCQLRSTLCERFVLSFKALNESDPLQTKYCLFFSLALSMLARDYRTGIAGTRDLIKCAGYAQQCINGEKKLNIPKADGYLQVALCLNARMEDMLNVTDTKMNGTLPFSSQLADAVREAVRDYHEGSMYKRDEAVRTFRRNLFPRWKPSLGNVLACCDIFQIILEAAYEKYVSAANQNNQNYQEIARLGYVSKAYLVLAAIGTSGGALNLLAQMLINQANQYEADQRIPFFRRHPDIGTFVQQHAAPYGWPLNDNYALAYRVLQIVCGIQRGSQPYSHMKKAELVLKGYVSESSSTQLTSLNIAINGGLAMGHYWKGRLLLEQAKQDHDRCNDYKDAAIASFCATNVTERFDHLPENADEDAAPQLSPPQWLSAIELLRYPDREVFRVDRRMVFQTIYQKLTQQVEEVQSDRIQIHNERYRLTKKDVRSNMERCLDMVKVQFPDKEPLIQEMIRSIR